MIKFLMFFVSRFHWADNLAKDFAVAYMDSNKIDYYDAIKEKNILELQAKRDLERVAFLIANGQKPRVEHMERG